MRLVLFLLLGICLCPLSTGQAAEDEWEEAIQTLPEGEWEDEAVEGEWEDEWEGEVVESSSDSPERDEFESVFGLPEYIDIDEQDADDETRVSMHVIWGGDVGDDDALLASLPTSLPDPVYVLESVDIAGNVMTSRERILAIMQLAPEDQVRLQELETAQARLAMSGIFEDVEMELQPGSDFRRLKIKLRLKERLHIQVNDYHVGISEKSTFWLGLDVSYLNVLGTGQRFRLAYAATPRNDHALHASYLIPSLAGSPFSLSLSFLSVNSREDLYWRQLPAVGSDGSKAGEFRTERHEANAMVGFKPHKNVALYIGVQPQFILRQDLTLDMDASVDSLLPRGNTVNTMGSFRLVFDTRDRARMPRDGHLLVFQALGTYRTAISDYSFIRLGVFHQGSLPLNINHTLRFLTFAGAVFGNAPYFQKFFYNDYNAFTPGQIFGLNPTHLGTFDIFGTGASDLGYEDFLVSFGVEYAWQLPIYRANIGWIELFARVDAAYADSLDVHAISVGIHPGKTRRTSFPVDASINLGVRIETFFGVFNVSLAHIMKMVPRSL